MSSLPDEREEREQRDATLLVCCGSGKLSKAATVELMDFSRHLRDHPKGTIADGCRFCANRVSPAALPETKAE